MQKILVCVRKAVAGDCEVFICMGGGHFDFEFRRQSSPHELNF